MRLDARHAAIAVLFLFALLLVGFFWQDGTDGPGPLPEEQHTAVVPAEPVRVADPLMNQGTVRAAERPRGNEVGGSLPMGSLDDRAGEAGRVRTLGQGHAEHRLEPGGAPRVELEGGSTLGSEVARAAGTEALQPLGRRERDVLADLAGGDTQAERGRGTVPFLKDNRDVGAGTSVDTHRQREEERRAAEAARAEREAPVAKPAARRTYTVKSGDALSRIASRECGSGANDVLAAICRLNGLSDPDKIRAGMVLELPARVEAGAQTAAALRPETTRTPEPVASNAAGRRTVVIAEGDMLSLVLQRELGSYSRSIAKVQELNPGLDPDTVRPGQTIVLPLPTEIPGATKAPVRRAPVVDEGPRVAANDPRPRVR